MLRPRAVAVASLLAFCAAGAMASPAAAVFPGANGRLIVDSQLYDPPNPSPVPYPFSPLSHVRFSADDLHVAGTEGNAPTSIGIADIDGTNQRKLTTYPYAQGNGDSGPTWSPDGKEIAFGREGQPLDCPPPIQPGQKCPGHQLLVVDVATGATRSLFGPDVDTMIGPLDWSPVPDSHTLLAGVSSAGYSGSEPPPEVDLIDTDSGARRTLATSPSPAEPLDYARFAPDGQSVVTATSTFLQQSLRPTISVVPIAGGTGVSFKAQTPDGVVFPTFTPDGQSITFADCRPGCGVWNALLPPPDAPPGTPPTFTELFPTSSYFPSTFDWEPLIDEPVITAGPSGRTKDDTATFEFSVPSTEPGKYQCRLDLGSWEDDCKSPKEYTGLGDGDHTFDVRFYVQGQNPDDAPIASRTWTVDTTPPEAVIDQAPSGQTTSTDATIFFHSTEPDGATFVCSQDGGPEYDCSSPQQLSGLGDGAHSFAVKAIDDVGNEQQSATPVSWEVKEPESGGGGSGGSGSGSGGTAGGTGSTTPPETPTSDCPGGRFTKVTAGAAIAVGRGTTCFVRTPHRDGSIAWSAAGVITLNGVQLTPSGRPIILNQSGSSLAVELPGGTTLGFGSFTWTLTDSVNLPVTAAASAAHFLLPKLKGKFKVAGIDVAASPDFELTTKDGGSASVKLNLELPKIFSGAAGDDKGAASMTFKFEFITSNDKGVRFTFKTTVKNAWLFGKVQLSQLSLGLQSQPLTFDGVASLKFPGVDGTFTIAVGLSGEGEQAFPLVTELNLQASELEKPIAEGVFLQRLGGGFTRCVGDDKQTGGLLSANAGVSFGPKLTVPGIFDGEPASLDGNVTLSLCDPKSIAVSGTGSIVEVPIAAATAKYIWSQGRIELSGKLTLKISGWGLTAAVDKAFFDMPSKTWNVHATGELKLPPWTGGVLDGKGEAVISTNGLAACLGKPGQRYGFGKHWGEQLQPFSDTCDLGPYSAGSAAVPVAGAAQRFSVPANSRIELVTIQGADGPPLVSLTGPGGQRFDTPADGSALRTPRAFIGRDPTTNATYAILFSPAAGAWTIQPLAGAAGPTSVQVADGLPPARVNARVRRADNRRVLTWRLRQIPGQAVTFLEHGASTDRVLLTTARAQGLLRFAPAPGAGGTRQIVALVTEHGLARTRLVVARFTAPPPPRLRAVTGLHRHRASLTWKSQPAAARYSLLLRTGNATTLAVVTRRAHLRMPAAMRRAKLRVWITALDATGKAGPLKSATLRR